MQAVAQTARRSHLRGQGQANGVLPMTRESLWSPLAKETTRLSTDADLGQSRQAIQIPDLSSGREIHKLSEREVKARLPQDSVCNYTQGAYKSATPPSNISTPQRTRGFLLIRKVTAIATTDVGSFPDSGTLMVPLFSLSASPSHWYAGDNPYRPQLLHAHHDAPNQKRSRTRLSLTRRALVDTSHSGYGLSDVRHRLPLQELSSSWFDSSVQELHHQHLPASTHPTLNPRKKSVRPVFPA